MILIIIMCLKCPEVKGSGLKLRMGSGLYLKTENKNGSNIYDISDEEKYGSGFLSAIMKVLPVLAKKGLASTSFR